jgi:flagellar basal-body rod modification protein FlgD
MSTVPGINNGTTGTSTTNTSQSGKKVLGEDDFLKMLIAQLKNQDPLNPLDGKDFAAQLAQFSSLDQLTQINTQLSALASSLASTNNSQAVSLIGDEVVANGSSVTVSGTSTTLAYNLSQNVQQGTISIYDTSNVTPGTYTFAVSAADSGGNAVSANTMMTGPVTGVTFKNSVPYLSVNGQDVALSDVVYIAKPGN